MSKSLNTLIASLLLAGTGHAFAASSVDLSVKGLITPSACTPALSDGGVHEIGKLGKGSEGGYLHPFARPHLATDRHL